MASTVKKMKRQLKFEPSQPGTPERQVQQPKKPRWCRPGTVAWSEIRKFKKSIERLVPFASMARMVQVNTHYYTRKGVSHWTLEALVTLQEAAEFYLAQVFDVAIQSAKKHKRDTLTQKDLQAGVSGEDIGDD